jgi:NAD(P)H-hydrate repair Nnr-like enzyme with NAD(P)H-hydrate dehydratase domain
MRFVSYYVLLLDLWCIMSLKIFNIKWNDIYHLGRAVVPPLTYESYKGLHGRIGIVGGSPDYTGS